MADAQRANVEVVIAGAHFGDNYATTHLVYTHADITLIDRQNHHLFQPPLYQVATTVLRSSKITTPIQSIFTAHCSIRVVMGEVTGVDTLAP
jgi:NADH:ubiquinone reductase (H+-translocating)